MAIFDCDYLDDVNCSEGTCSYDNTTCCFFCEAMREGCDDICPQLDADAVRHCNLLNSFEKVIRYKRENKELPGFYKDNPLNAGYDLFVNIPTPIEIAPGEVVRVSLNVAAEIPDGMVGLVFQRSSTYKKWGLKLTNNVGVIDALYRGDGDIWMAELKNETDKPVTLNPGDKICQVIFLQLPSIKLEEVEHLGNKDRGGFGTSFDNVIEFKKK